MACSTYNTKLFYKIAATDKVYDSAGYTEIKYLMEVPELGGTVEKIDVTTLSNPVKIYIPGTKDYGDLVFKFIYDNEAATANYRVLKAMDDDSVTASFKIQYPDGTTHEFDAIPSVKLDAGALNGALTFSVTMLLQSKISTINPTTPTV